MPLVDVEEIVAKEVAEPVGVPHISVMEVPAC
jgi:hypothetical protein